MKKTELKTTDMALSIVLPPVAVSSVILETSGGLDFHGTGNCTLVVLHIIVTVALSILVYNHIRLHSGSVAKWPEFFRRTRKQNRILFWVMLATSVTGMLSVATYFFCGHTPFGGIHGKIGFLAILIMFLHMLHRRKFFLR